MGQMEFSLLSTENMFFLVVGDRVICYNDHGYIPMVPVITRLAGGCHWDLFLLYFIDSIKGSPVTGKKFKNMSIYLGNNICPMEIRYRSAELSHRHRFSELFDPL